MLFSLISLNGVTCFWVKMHKSMINNEPKRAHVSITNVLSLSRASGAFTFPKKSFLYKPYNWPIFHCVEASSNKVKQCHLVWAILFRVKVAKLQCTPRKMLMSRVRIWH